MCLKFLRTIFRRQSPSNVPLLDDDGPKLSSEASVDDKITLCKHDNLEDYQTLENDLEQGTTQNTENVKKVLLHENESKMPSNITPSNPLLLAPSNLRDTSTSANSFEDDSIINHSHTHEKTQQNKNSSHKNSPKVPSPGADGKKGKRKKKKKGKTSGEVSIIGTVD